MASGTVVFLSPSGDNIIQAAPGFFPSTILQPTGTVQYVPYLQYGGQQLGGSSNPPQQNRQAGALEKFLKVETKTLGAIQIMIGLIHIGFGAVSVAFLNMFYFIPLTAVGGYPFWGGVFFIASGSVAVSAEKNPTTSLVKSSVGLNITSAVMASVGIILYITELAINNNSYSYYSDQHNSHFSPSVNTGLSILLLLFSMLEFCITVSSAHFGCEAVCCKSNPTTMVFVPYVATGDGVAPSEGVSAPPPAYEPKVE